MGNLTANNCVRIDLNKKEDKRYVSINHKMTYFEVV